jgi:hypothetical protein
MLTGRLVNGKGLKSLFVVNVLFIRTAQEYF